MTQAIEPFRLNVPERQLDDLRDRLSRTRWPERETVTDWSQGIPLERVKAFVEYWHTSYDWRRCEASLNTLGQYRTEIDGLRIHFLHIRSPEPNALPLIMTHGWPGSVIEFNKVIGPLTNPVAHGGSASDAFHLVLPSLPGYGFSDKPRHAGWTVERIGRAWLELMRRLGYTRFVAQGGDWGSAVTTAIARIEPPECVAAHLNVAIAYPPAGCEEVPTPAEAAALADFQKYQEQGSGYAAIQTSTPQTIGYGLVDSPTALAAWIYEKYHYWTDTAGVPETVLSTDEMLDNIMLYWLPGTGASAARLYWESAPTGFLQSSVATPMGISIFPKEIFRASRRWAERVYSNLFYWNELEKGGHFAAFEQPDLFVNELRACFGRVR